MTDARDLINNEVVELSKSNNAILLNKHVKYYIIIFLHV